MRHASLFSGIGGFDLAAEWMGWTNVFTCEIDSFPRQVLKHHFPNATHYEDIKQTDFSVHKGQVDILTGGFPCQPFSTAGKRLGKEDERHLWPEMLRAIREIEPKYIVGENVRGILNWSDGLVVDEVFSDLEGEGYEVFAFVLPAAGINAPHRRDRVWIIAHRTQNTMRSGFVQREPVQEGAEIRQQRNAGSRDCDRVRSEEGTNASNTSSERCGGGHQRSEADQRTQWQMDQDERHHQDGVRGKTTGRGATSSDTTSDRRSRQGQSIEAQEGYEARSESARIMEGGSERLRQQRYASNSNKKGSSTEYKPKSTHKKGWQDENRPVEQHPGYDRRALPTKNWQDFPTQSPVCGGDDGIPERLDGITFPKWRNQSIKAYGNAIVPQLAYRIFKAIQAISVS